MTEARSVQEASTMLTPENNTPTNVCVCVCVGGVSGAMHMDMCMLSMHVWRAKQHTASHILNCHVSPNL